MRADPAVVDGVKWALRPGREHARSGREIAEELHVPLRRIGEAVAFLIEEQGFPVCSTARDGYYLATTAEEIEDSLREAEKRARMMLRRRRFLRRALARLQGQTSIEGVA